MKYMAKQNAFWKDDKGNLVHIVGRVTVVESDRDLCNDRPPYFYPVEETAQPEERHERSSSLLDTLYKRNPHAIIHAAEEID